MKKHLAFLLTVVLVIGAIAGCASTADAVNGDSAAANEEVSEGAASQGNASVDTSDQEYAFILSLSALEFFNDPKAGINDAADQIGVKVTVMGPTDLDSQGVTQAIEEAVAKGVNGILLWGQFPGVTD